MSVRIVCGLAGRWPVAGVMSEVRIWKHKHPESQGCLCFQILTSLDRATRGPASPQRDSPGFDSSILRIFDAAVGPSSPDLRRRPWAVRLDRVQG